MTDFSQRPVGELEVASVSALEKLTHWGWDEMSTIFTDNIFNLIF